MTIYLVHHADAVGPDIDTRRPLSSEGLAQAASLADRAKASGAAPAKIWHSGKLRSKQTAEIFWRVCSPFADFRMVRGLRPDDPPEWMTDLLGAEAGDVLVVGHMPLMPALARRLTPGAEAFPLHGLIALQKMDDGTYVERWRMT